MYSHQTCQVDDIPQGAPTYKFVWSLNRVVTIQNISTFRRPVGTKLDKALSSRERLSTLRSHDVLITGPMGGHMANWKKYISNITRFMVTKLGRVMTSGRRFRLQTHWLLFPFNYTLFPKSCDLSLRI